MPDPPHPHLPPPSTPPLQEVNEAIKACRTWQELAGVLEAKGAQMDAENIAGILFKVGMRT